MKYFGIHLLVSWKLEAYFASFIETQLDNTIDRSKKGEQFKTIITISPVYS